MSQQRIDRALDLLEQDVTALNAKRQHGYAQTHSTICGCRVVASLVTARKRAGGKPPLIWFCDNIELTRDELRKVLLRCENRVGYYVALSERQRNIVTGLLRKLVRERRLEDLDEAAILLCLFEDLPSEETKSPGIIHGLCI